MLVNKQLNTDGDKRGGYSGSTDAARVPPPAKIPSDSVQQSPRPQAEPPTQQVAQRSALTAYA